MNRTSPITRIVLVLLCVLGLAVATACTTGSEDEGSAGEQTSAAPKKTKEPEATAVTLTPPDGSTGVNPLTPLVVNASKGIITSISVTNNDGNEVQGTLSPDGLTWTSGELLGYARTYTVNAETVSVQGVEEQYTGSIQTVVPNNQTKVTTIPGKPGNTYGVGMPLIVKFDEPITDKAAAEQHMKVTTNPPVEGAWYWFSDKQAHWRPQNFYQPGTTVSLEVDIYGKDLGGGLYGQENHSTSFTVGDAMVSEIDNSDLQLKTYKNGQLVRTMPASLGEPKYPSQSGVHVVQEKYEMKIMDSSTWGLPTDHPDGYYEEVPYATRISMSGEFVHAAPWSVADQGVRNVSHGCINLSMDNGKWFYENASYGDIVIITGTEADLKPGDGWGDWNVPWETWKAGGKK
ncbi:Ig-like domain-containing protein [Blastococcus sp. Marseille-P5729]|uniref:L,D-transpeptidase n=1 Tax=Blastococcus sp. Marseille-P5729 TaxID=2086582 RepID=UPI00131A8C3C|nr:Ig-like domain-containing protein [Blastococcus sp. Marseille-P5729]